MNFLVRCNTHLNMEVMEFLFLNIKNFMKNVKKKVLNFIGCISKVIKQDFRKNPETYFISYNTKNNFFGMKKLFYSYK